MNARQRKGLFERRQTDEMLRVEENEEMLKRPGEQEGNVKSRGE